jgi:hypothetical protein
MARRKARGNPEVKVMCAAQSIQTERKWTNPSVLKLAPTGDPVARMVSLSRDLVLRARDQGWGGPPFDPFLLAQHTKVSVVPREDIADARTVPTSRGQMQIEFNPNRPQGRIRFSIAHEIAHLLFPDSKEQIRNRASHREIQGDQWQIEMLCNIGAAEILMPVGSFPELRGADLSVDHLMRLRADYDVSTESVFMRLVHLTDQPAAIFASSRIESGPMEGRYRVDYALRSRSSSLDIERGLVLPEGCVVEECTAIGFTAKREQHYPATNAKLPTECVGIPPYPGHRYPRVMGLVLAPQLRRKDAASITYLVGDATEPRGTGNRIIAHVVNDRTPRWGGGFALVVRREWPLLQDEFVTWAETDRSRLRLGNVHFAAVQEGLTVCSMVSQHGYGPSPTPRIRYEALGKCLTALAEKGGQHGATVHTPRIGCGQAGGSWDVVSELLEDSLCRTGVQVTVYDVPGQEFRPKKDDSLFR